MNVRWRVYQLAWFENDGGDKWWEKDSELCLSKAIQTHNAALSKIESSETSQTSQDESKYA